jgi:LysR family transcriptional regulator, transcriptional activator for leuABCD operon
VLNLRSVDLNLLPVFEAAYEERSLSRAAERLAMTQSAVSHALTRLRALFHDELFIRQARGVLPTPAADRVYAKVRTALGSVRDSVTDMRGFDPKTSERRFFVAITHPLGPMIAVRMRERLATSAPKVEIAFSTRSRPVDLERGLREGRIDAAVDWLLPGLPHYSAITLFDDGLVAVARRGHPALRQRNTKKGLRDYEFVSLRPRVEGENPLPGIREWQRLNLKVVLEVSEIIEVFMVASQSDLCGLIPRSMEKAARDLLGLRALPATPRTPSVPIKLIWRKSRETDPAHRFLRLQIAGAAREMA